LARYGGEEFVIILPESGVDDAVKVAERIRTSLEESDHGQSVGPRVTVSAGVASYPEQGRTRHALGLNADAALYYSKQTGKNKVTVFETEHRKIYHATTEKLKTLLGENRMEAIEALSAAVDAKDQYTRGHSDSVTRYALAIAKKLGLPEQE